jgi:hypothetical protein
MYPINLNNVPDGFGYGQLCYVDPIEILSKGFTKHTATQVKKLLDEKILDKNFQELNLDTIKELENVFEIIKSAVD